MENGGAELKKLTESPVAAASNLLPEPSTNPNSSEQLAAAARREDGELFSSSDDDENYSSRLLESSGTDIPSEAAGLCLVEPTKKSMQSIPAENGTQRTSPVNSVDVSNHISLQANNDKSFVKNRISSGSSNSGWQAASAGDNNLVISFSDEDNTGSESEDRSQKKVLGCNSRKNGTDGNGRFLPIASMPTKLQHAGNNVRNTIPRKPFPSSTFVSSASKINGRNNSRAWPGQTQTSRVRYFNNGNRRTATQENTFELGLNQARVQDLRQQIALRQQELMLKSGQLNKQCALVSVKDNSSTNLSMNARRKSNAMSPGAGAAPKEPDRKRLKLSGSSSGQLKADRQHVNLPPKPIQTSSVQTAALEQQNVVIYSNNSSPKRRTVLDAVRVLEQDNQLPHKSSSANPTSTSTDDKCVMPKRTGIQRSPDRDNLHKVHQHSGPSKPVMSELQLINNQGTSGGRIISPPAENIFQSSLNNASFSSSLGAANFSEHCDKDLQPLVEMEETLDRELEEAQEQRHRYEIEERNALKAYRRAQRALIEANARCTELYRKRELYSTHFRSLIMDSRLLWSAGDRVQSGMDLSPAEHACKNIHLIPTSTQQKQLLDAQNLRSEPCSEPDVSMSEPLHRGLNNAANRGSSPLDDPNVPSDGDEDEVVPLEHDTVRSRNIEPASHNSSEQSKDSDHRQYKNSTVNDSPDTLILEASLRSELFARLGMRAFPKSTVSSRLESADELGTENDDESERTQISDSSLPVSPTERHQERDIKGKDNAERSISEAPAQDINADKTSYSTADSGHVGSPIKGYQSTPTMLSTPTVLRSVFGHLKVMSPTAFLAVEGIGNQTHNTIDTYAGDDNNVDSMVVQYTNLTATSLEESTKDIYTTEIGSFNSTAAVDPFWPLCMYELRGKCNNSECPWQHAADFSGGNKNQRDGSRDSGCSPELQMARTTAKPSNLGGILELPTYLVGLDIMKARTQTYESIVACKDGKCWQKAFSACLALSSLLVKDLPANELFLCGNDGRIEVQGSSITQLSCFHSRNSLVNQARPSSTQALEMSLNTLCQEVNKVENMRKALAMLSRAIESDPASEALWILYLLVYYSNMKSIEKDDMFGSAVILNPGSYGLRLMHINSRVHLNERLGAYNEAIRALCAKVSVSGKGEEMHSACILDLFLQMLDCFCMSGNVNTAVQKIYGLFGLATYSDEPNSLLLSDILTCLTISDKYVFWVCCVYLAIYRKLPVIVLQQFECQKDLPAIQWSTVDLSDDEKNRAVLLVERVTDSVKLLSYSESPGSEANKRAVQNFALSHIGCVMALGRVELCWTLLEKYLDMLPEFLELVLVRARSQATDYEGSSLDGFENALTSWPKEAPGIAGLWNQYVEFVLERRGPDLAKQLLARWYSSISEVTSRDSNHPVESLASASVSNPEFSMPYSKQMDIMFGFLNLSLAKLLLGDHIEARAAIDRAFKRAVPAYFNHCLVEHAAFLLNHEQLRQTKDDSSPTSERLRILRGYLDDARDLFLPIPLSREFIKSVEKPRVQQLISSILSPVSSEFLLVNLVLEVWYGPSLLPPWDSISDEKQLVDLVEAILEMVPSNYPLALSVCRMLREGSCDRTSSRSLFFWSSSTLVHSIFQAIPVAPEFAWVEAAEILAETDGADLLSERFYKRALSVYPFSKKLWCRYKDVVKDRRGHGCTIGAVVEEARSRGIELE